VVSARIERRVLAWERLDEPGSEICVVTLGEGGGLAEGTTVCVGSAPFAWRWRVAWDDAWRTREAMVERLDSEAAIALTADGRGGWIDGAGARVAAFDGCLDIDLAATPFTNTLAIHRLGLAVGETRDVIVAYLAAPDPLPRAVAQRYSRPAEDRWRYEAIFRGFTAELRLDADGLIADYEHMFRRRGAA
jgi:hypothetical protein